jgi:hypothetical protein
VVIALSLEIWAGVTVEEFFLVTMPFTVGTGVVFGSVTGFLGKRAPDSTFEQDSRSEKLQFNRE